jgi:hypothetical protein
MARPADDSQQVANRIAATQLQLIACQIWQEEFPMTSRVLFVWQTSLRVATAIFCVLFVPLCFGATGLFKHVQRYDTTGGIAFSVQTTDVNGDGKLDLLVTNYCRTQIDCTNGTIDVFLGRNDGTFQSPQTFSSGGSYAVSLAVADINGDGKPDLAVANMCSTQSCTESLVAALFGNGDGTFQAAQTYDVGAVGAESVAIRDINGDAKPDLLVAYDCLLRCDGGVAVLIGNGNGTFQTAQSHATGGSYAKSVAAGDLNGDGKPDLVVANECLSAADCSAGNVGVLLGNGNGTFQTVQTYGSGGKDTVSAAIGDVNGDGKPDILLANDCVSPTNCQKGSPGIVGVLLNHGDGTFQNVATYNSGGRGANAVALADINRDGKPDLVVVNFCFSPLVCSQGGVAVLSGNGDGTFLAAQSFKTGGFNARSVAVADVSGDGKLDVLVANQCFSKRLCGNGVVGLLLGSAP